MAESKESTTTRRPGTSPRSLLTGRMAGVRSPARALLLKRLGLTPEMFEALQEYAAQGQRIQDEGLAQLGSAPTGQVALPPPHFDMMNMPMPMTSARMVGATPSTAEMLMGAPMPAYEPPPVESLAERYYIPELPAPTPPPTPRVTTTTGPARPATPDDLKKNGG